VINGREAELSDPRERLRDAGLRATRPRIAILRWLDDHPGHHAADRIVERTALPRATVYHALGQLSDAGVVLTVGTADGVSRYETAADAHHHFTCRVCGRIVDVACVVDDAPCIHATVPGAVVEQADVTFRGVCQDCAD
jgi:Fur family ferric uptake transcriptional regulator